MERENQNCPCKKLSCESHGDCDACRRKHQTVKKQYLPACEQPAFLKKRKKKQ